MGTPLPCLETYIGSAPFSEQETQVHFRTQSLIVYLSLYINKPCIMKASNYGIPPPTHMVAYPGGQYCWPLPLLIPQLPPQDPPFCQALCIYDTRLRYVLLFYSVFIITMKLMKHHKIWPPTPIYFLAMFIIFQAVRDFILSQPGKFISYLAIHSYGSKIVYPWSSTEEKVLTINKRTLNSL